MGKSAVGVPISSTRQDWIGFLSKVKILLFDSYKPARFNERIVLFIKSARSAPAGVETLHLGRCGMKGLSSGYFFEILL